MADERLLQLLIVGMGARRYRVERPWGRLPGGSFPGSVTWVATDADDSLYVFQRYDSTVHKGPAPAVSVFRRDGEFVGTWGDGFIKDAHGIYVTRAGTVMLVDRDAHQVLAFDRKGVPIFTIGKRDVPNAPFNHPTNLAEGPDGFLYVSDGYGNTNVHKFSASGEHVRTWGRPGSGPGEFSVPHGICVTADNRVLVGDRENGRVQIFDPDGGYLGELTNVYNPMSVCVDPSGTIFVSDQVPRLTAFAPDGSRIGGCRPVLHGGHGMSIDSAGNIYLAESRPNRVTKLSVLNDWHG